MLKLQAKPTFWAPVFISVPGVPKAAKIDVEFNFNGKREVTDLLDRLQSDTLNDLDLMLEIVAGWKGVDEPFSEANLEHLLNMCPTSANSILTVYTKEVFQAKEKN